MQWLSHKEVFQGLEVLWGEINLGKGPGNLGRPGTAKVLVKEGEGIRHANKVGKEGV